MSQALTTQTEKFKSVQDLLSSEGMQKQLRMALPKHVSSERIARLALTQIRRTPKLLECDRQSLLGAIMEAGQLGLEPGSMGQAWIVPYGSEATLLIGYRGMLDLAWRSSKIKSVAAHVVYDGDDFRWLYGLEPILAHKPASAPERGEISHVYAIIETANGGTMFDVMSIDDIEQVRERSRSKKSGPWVTDYAEMAKKTVLRRLLKLAPCSAELQRAVTLDEQAELGISQDLGSAIDITPDDATDGDGEIPYSQTIPEGEGQ